MPGEEDPDLGATVRDLIQHSAPEVLLSNENVQAALGELAEDDEAGPVMGISLRTALAAMDAPDVVLLFQALMTRWGRQLPTIGLSAGAAGDVAVLGDLIPGSDKLRELITATPASIPIGYDAFAHAKPLTAGADAGKVEWLSHLATALILEQASPLSGPEVTVVPASGVLNYDANATRVAKVSISAALALSPLIWTNLKGASVARLTITNTAGSAVNLTLQSGPDDGHSLIAASNMPISLPVGKTLIEFGRRAGNKCYTRVLGSVFDTDATVQVRDFKFVRGVSTNTLTFAGADKPSVKAGDTLLVIASYGGGSTQPVISGATAQAIGGDANAPAIRVALRQIAADDEDLSGLTITGAIEVHALVLFKPGGTPTLGTPAYTKNNSFAIGAGTQSWAAASLGSVRGIYVGFHQLLAMDQGQMRPTLNLIQTGTTTSPTAPAQSLLGVSDPTTADLAAITTDKTNTGGTGQGRTITLLLPFT